VLALQRDRIFGHYGVENEEIGSFALTESSRRWEARVRIHETRNGRLKSVDQYSDAEQWFLFGLNFWKGQSSIVSAGI
jgi:hypothetical protein